MPGGVRVFAGVLVWRAVTAERDTTCLAGPQMNPVCADLHAFFTLAARSVFDRRNRIQMRTRLSAHQGIIQAAASFRNLVAAAMAKTMKSVRTMSCVSLNGGSVCVGAIIFNAGIFSNACTIPTNTLK